MSHSTARPVVTSVIAGAVTKVIPLNRHASRTRIDVVLTGANTFSIDETLDTVLWDAAVIASAWNVAGRTGDVTDPTTANWAEIQVSASASSSLVLNSPIAAIRIVKSAGAGTAEVRIQQT